jgi:hypothetical protein
MPDEAPWDGSTVSRQPTAVGTGPQPDIGDVVGPLEFV